MIGVAIVSLALLAFTYVGYPVLIGLLARLRPVRRVTALGAERPTVSVCLPVRNGEAFLAAKLECLLAQEYPADKVEIFVYLDGCTDGSERIARAIADRPTTAGRVRVLASPHHRGKPTAINRVVKEARGELLLLNDVRQRLDADTLLKLAAWLNDPGVGCVSGNLVLEGGAGSGLYWKYENWIRRQESRFRSVVGATGAIMMVRRQELLAAGELPEALILDDVWIPMKMRLAGKAVVLDESACAYDTAFEDDREFRRKVRTLGGNFQLFALLPRLLLPGWGSWLETMGHKVARLVAPAAMVALAIASVRLAQVETGTVRVAGVALTAAQMLLYAGAAVGHRAGKLAGVARTFVVLNAAVIVGFWRWLTRRLAW